MLVLVASEVAETWVLIVTSEAAGFFAPSDTVEDNTVELEVDKGDCRACCSNTGNNRWSTLRMRADFSGQN